MLDVNNEEVSNIPDKVDVPEKKRIAVLHLGMGQYVGVTRTLYLAIDPKAARGSHRAERLTARRPQPRLKDAIRFRDCRVTAYIIERNRPAFTCLGLSAQLRLVIIETFINTT